MTDAVWHASRRNGGTTLCYSERAETCPCRFEYPLLKQMLCCLVCFATLGGRRHQGPKLSRNKGCTVKIFRSSLPLYSCAITCDLPGTAGASRQATSYFCVRQDKYYVKDSSRWNVHYANMFSCYRYCAGASS